MVRDAGGTLYYDGANLNAIMGRTRPGDMGFDIVHVNLHKSFSQPHGGGGPGAGPIAVSDRIEPYLPVPRLVRAEGANGASAGVRSRSRSPEVDRAAARLCGQLRRLRPLLRLHHEPWRRRAHGGVGDRGAERQLPARPAARGARREVPAGRLRPPVPARVRPLRRPREARARHQDARRRQAAARLRLPPADDLLPAAGRRGADVRADRDRDPRGPRRARRRRSTRSSPRPSATPRSPATRPTRRRCAASTRRPRAAGRSSASRSDRSRPYAPLPRSSGSSCFSSSTGSNRSPRFSTRSSTSVASKRATPGLLARRRPRPRSHSTGVETVGCSRARSE